MTPWVTIVIPVYNGRRFLDEAIRSVIGQNYGKLEVIVVDDGSTDGSAEIASRYLDQLTLICQENAGQSAALTAGWRRARGEFIGYLSADDCLREGAVGKLARALAAHPQVVLAYCDFGIIDESGDLTRVIRSPDFTRAALYAELRCLPGPGALFKRKAYENAGPWRRDFRQIPDLEFFLRLALEGDFIRVPDVLADFRKHGSSITYSYVPPERCGEPVRMVEDLLTRNGLPKDVLNWRRKMIASARYLCAVLHGQSGRRRSAIRELMTALMLDPKSASSRRALSAFRTILRSSGHSASGDRELQNSGEGSEHK